MELNHQVALITGGSSGMGLACAKDLTQKGLRVVIWDKQIIHPEFDAIEVDVCQSRQVEQALKETIERVGIPRICINCAGIAPAKKMVNKEGEMPLDLFQEVIQVNLIGTYQVMCIVANAMSTLEPVGEAQERGVIINTASIAAFEGQIGQTAYSASKGGIVALTLPAARELAQFGIRVNTIAPGLIATPMLLNMPEKVQESLAQTVPFPKRFGKSEEFSLLAVHLIENCLINGEVIRLDGALRMQPR